MEMPKTVVASVVKIARAKPPRALGGGGNHPGGGIIGGIKPGGGAHPPPCPGGGGAEKAPRGSIGPCPGGGCIVIFFPRRHDRCPTTQRPVMFWCKEFAAKTPRRQREQKENAERPTSNFQRPTFN